MYRFLYQPLGILGPTNNISQVKYESRLGREKIVTGIFLKFIKKDDKSFHK